MNIKLYLHVRDADKLKNTFPSCIQRIGCQTGKAAAPGCRTHVLEGLSHLLDHNVTGDTEGQA